MVHWAAQLGILAAKQANDQWKPGGWKPVDRQVASQGERGWNLKANKGKAGYTTRSAMLYKQAVLEPAWGALGGAYVSPRGHKLQGTLRGAGVGAISALGGLGTGTIGYHLAKDRVPGTVNIAGYQVPRAALIGLLSTLPGNAAGYFAGKRMFWPGHWQDPEEPARDQARKWMGLSSSKEGAR